MQEIVVSEGIKILADDSLSPDDNILLKELLSVADKSKQDIVTLENIRLCVCSYFTIPVSDFTSNVENRTYEYQRSLICFFYKQFDLHYPLRLIADFIGKKSHGAVLNGINKIQRLEKEDASVYRDIVNITQMIKLRYKRRC